MSNTHNSKALSAIVNAFILPVGNKPTTRSIDNNLNTLFNRTAGGSFDVNKNLANTFIPVPPSRIAEDPTSWREAIMEAERSILPFRVKMQEIFRDTALNAHVKACIEKRKNLTLLRRFALVDKNGIPNKEWTEYLNKSWFRNFLSYAIDARFFGYTLISLGDIDQGNFNKLTILRRDNISPEREHVTAAPYIPTGISWNEAPYNEWHVWIPTPTEDGTMSCGKGLFYSIALIEIYLRNMTSDNVSYMELFGAPYRALFMEDINNETERGTAEAALRNQGSLGYGVFGKNDKLEIISGGPGAGYKSYGDADTRWERKISKLILGHSDALESTPGKLGSGQGGAKGDHSPIKDALVEIQASDANFILPFVNNELLTRCRYHGIEIPEDLEFQFLNSEEDEKILNQKTDIGVKLSTIAANLAKSGDKIDKDWFEENTGIKLDNDTIKKENNKENGAEEKNIS